MNLLENEWYSIEFYRPPRNLEVLCRFSDGHMATCRHNGIYWVGQHNIRITESLYHPTHFLIFTPFNANDEL